MFLLLAPTPVQGIQPGSFSSEVIHQKVVGELGKIKKFGEQIGNPSISIRQVPDKTQRKSLEVAAGSEFNIADKKTSELVEISNQLKKALNAAKKGLDKNTIAVFNAKSDILKAIGEIELEVAKGSYSIDASFARKKRADQIIRASLKIAESGGLEDKNVALENLAALKEFQNVPSVALALAKNAPRIMKLETGLQNPALLPFIAASAGAKGFGGGNKAIPAELAKKFSSGGKQAASPNYSMAV